MIKNKNLFAAAWILAAFLMAVISFPERVYASELTWREGVGIGGSGTEYKNTSCISTDYIAAEGPYLRYDLNDYMYVELRIYEYDQDKNYIDKILVSGNQHGKCSIAEDTAYVKIMLADWKTGPITAAFSSGTSLEWQRYEKPTYYFAIDGDDSNPGTEAAPKKDPRPYIEDGNVIIRLRGGDTFPYVLKPGSNTQISNYGSGFAIIDGSRQTEDVFSAIGGGLYEISVTGDVGCVWLDGQDPNWMKLPAGTELTEDGTYSIFHDEGKIRMRSDSDISGQHLNYTAGESGIEIDGVSDVNIMYMDIRNWGWNGVNMTRAKNIKVAECMIETIGGGQIHGTDDGLRFGNGIQVGLYGCSNIQIFENIITGCYDAGMTPQTWSSEKGSGDKAENIVFDRNYVERCFWCFEYATGENVGLPSRISCRSNLFMNAEDITGGYRWDGCLGPSFFCIGTADQGSSMTASGNNCMGTAKYALMFYSWANARDVWFQGNTFYLNPDTTDVRTPYKYHGSDDRINY